MNAPTLLIGTATYGRAPSWHQFVPQHPADCGCRRPPVDPWPSAPVVPPRRQLGVTR